MRNNTGVILQPAKPRDWVLGGVTGSSWEKVMEDGQWVDFIPKGETQNRYGLETMSCVSQSCCNVHETYLKARYDKELDFSDRVLAKLSGTTEEGNTFWRVAMTVRKHGFVPESAWPWTSDKDSWEEYYETIPVGVHEKCEEYMSKYEPQFAWVNVDVESMKEALKYSPLQVCNQWHAFCVVGYDKNSWITYDSYPGGDGDFLGLWDFNNPLQAAMGHVSLPLKPKPVYTLPEEAKVWEAEGQTRVGLHVKGKIYVDEMRKIDLQWQLRNRDMDTNIFSGGRVIPVTTELFDSFEQFDLKNNKLN